MYVCLRLCVRMFVRVCLRECMSVVCVFVCVCVCVVPGRRTLYGVCCVCVLCLCVRMRKYPGVGMRRKLYGKRTQSCAYAEVPRRRHAAQTLRLP